MRFIAHPVSKQRLGALIVKMAEGSDMEIWARCPECVRWFYCGRAGSAMPDVSPGCPVCGSVSHDLSLAAQGGEGLSESA